MLSVALIFCFFGFYLFYNTSKRAVFEPKNSLQHWVGVNELYAKSLGASALISSLVLCIMTLGMASGVFSYFVILMTIASCIIIAAPLNLIRPVYLIVSALIFLVLEFYISHHAS